MARCSEQRGDGGEELMHLITWDHRAQPNWEDLRAIFAELCLDVVLTEVDTGDDQYALLVSRDPISSAAAQVRYDQFLATGR